MRASKNSVKDRARGLGFLRLFAILRLIVATFPAI
jgi:hypothetical protein